MNYLNDGQILKYILETYCHVEYFTDDWGRVKRFLNDSRFPTRNDDFKRELAKAILEHKISVQEFEKLTGEEFETQEEVDEFLKTEVWQPLYGDEPIAS